MKELSTSRGSRWVWVSLVLLIALLAAACGDDSDDAPDSAQSDDTAADDDADADGSGTAEPDGEDTSDTEGSESGDDTAAPAEDEPVSGGSMTMLTLADTSSFDAAKMNTGTVGHQGQLVYGHLLYFDDQLQQQPGLALSAEVNETGDVWTISLRPDVVFSDGTPFNAEAVRLHFERVANPDTGSPAQGSAAQIASMLVIDDLTLEVTLAGPDYTWVYALGAIAPGGALTHIPSPTAVAEYGDEFGTTPETTVGAGPFVLTEWVPGESSSFERNESFYDAPKPYLDTLTFRVIGDETTRYNTFAEGEADVVYNVGTGATMGRLSDDYETGYGPFAGSISMHYNMSNAPTDDLRIREALSVGADVPAALDLISEGTLMVPEYYFPADSPFVAEPVPIPTYDPELAASNVQAYLEETGASQVDIVIRGHVAFTDLLTAMKQDYDQIDGLNVTFELGDGPETTTRERSRDWEHAFVTGNAEDPRSLLGFFLSTGEAPISYLDDPATNDALVQASGTTDLSVQQAMMQVVAERFRELLPFQPVFFTLRQWNWQDSVRGLEIMADAVIRTENLSVGS